MKKLLMLLPVLGLSFLLCSCTKSPADKAVDYSNQKLVVMKNGDLEKVEKIEKEVEEYVNTLTPEEQKEFGEAAKKYEVEHADEIEEACKAYEMAIYNGSSDDYSGSSNSFSSSHSSSHAFGGSLDDVGDGVEDALDDVGDGVEDILDDIGDGVEDLLDDVGDFFEDIFD